MSDDRRSSVPPEPGGDEDRNNSTTTHTKRLMERLLKRGLESGIGALSKSEATVHAVMEGLKIPKEMATVALDQIDETKKGLYGAVAKEIRDFLQSTNFAEDMKKILTGLAFEVKMEVRFKNAEDSSGNPTVRPDVSADVAIKDRDKKKKKPE